MAPFYDHQVGRFEAPRLDDYEIYLARARQARAQAFADLFGALFRNLAGVAKALIGSVRRPALMPPHGPYRRATPARLTRGCG